MRESEHSSPLAKALESGRRGDSTPNLQAQSPSLNLHFGPRVSSPSRQIQCPCLYLSLIQTILSAPNSELLLGFRLLYIWHNRNIFLILN